MCKLNKKNDGRWLDPCMEGLIRSLKEHGIETLSCCCGHGKYPMTIVYRHKSKSGLNEGAINGYIYDFCSGWGIPRKKKFYKKDKQGYYFIPEVNQPKQEICVCGHKQWDEHKCTFDPMVAQECNVKGCKCKKFKLRKL